MQKGGPHELHLRVVQHLARTAQPAIVIAASGMCAGGRVVNYLKALLPDARHDIVFCGYQAEGTPGRAIQASAGRAGQGRAGRAGPGGGVAGASRPPTVRLDDVDVPIRAQVHTLAGYSAHADQADLLNFASRCAAPGRPLQVRLVHGSEPAKATLGRLLRQRVPGVQVVVP